MPVSNIRTRLENKACDAQLVNTGVVLLVTESGHSCPLFSSCSGLENPLTFMVLFSSGLDIVQGS